MDDTTESKSVYQMAIEAIRESGQTNNLVYKITYGSTALGRSKYTVGDKIFWRIEVMGKKFIDLDFIECVRQAITFVYNAHENQK